MVLVLNGNNSDNITALLSFIFSVCLCVCVRVRERERERKRKIKKENIFVDFPR